MKRWGEEWRQEEEVLKEPLMGLTVTRGLSSLGESP